MNDKELILLGVGGHAKVIIDIAWLLGFSINGLYDDNHDFQNNEFYGVKLSGPIDPRISGVGIIAIGENKIRKKINENLMDVKWQTLIHPSAIISKDVEIGVGTVVMAGAIIQPGTRIGKHCIINTGACIDHDCSIEDFVHIAPNCSLAGGINIGEGTLIGIGSSIVQNIEVGRWTKVGAGSVLVHNQPSFCVSLGAPAKPIKFNNV
jgi:acetyltransferase EpsM